VKKNALVHPSASASVDATTLAAVSGGDIVQPGSLIENKKGGSVGLTFDDLFKQPTGYASPTGASGDKK
jgi:hypothetical protein